MRTFDSSDFRALAKTTNYDVVAEKSTLETFTAPSGALSVTLESKEFTSICPVTGQPDYGSVTIIYMPNARCLESKSLKLYLGAFRSEAGFWETLASRIGQDLVEVLDPIWLSVAMSMNARGGITIEARWDYPEGGRETKHADTQT